MKKALQGVRVIDMTRFLSGPLCSMYLADFGAEVIKVEIPGRGDDTREYGPYINGESGYYLSLNRNKQSITLNLKSAEGLEILKGLIKQADVLMENFSFGTMEKLGLSYDEVKAINPEIIYASCSGFGSNGPYARKPAYDAIIQGYGGIMSITGSEQNVPNRVGVSIGDITAGYYMTIGLLTALYHKEHTGEGQRLELSLLDCQVALLENPMMRYFATGVCPKPAGNRHASIAPYSAYPTKDGHMIVAAGNDLHWQRFCMAVGREELIKDERFLTNRLRVDNYGELEPIVVSILKTATTAEWIDLLESKGVPCGPINSVEAVANDPQVKAREMILEIEHPTAGKIKVSSNPIKMDKTPFVLESPPPVLGEHTAAVLKKYLGYDDDKIDELRGSGII
jgi:CoA:oxalate CoA-transferase